MWFDESIFGRAAMSEEDGQVYNVSEDGVRSLKMR
jgi:hypothetical protein